jgi:hypothetical protein
MPSGSVTPSDDSGSKHTENSIRNLSKKLRRQSSFHKAVLAVAFARSTPNEVSTEHTEQGQVKREVYWQYIDAASKMGFCLFLLAIVAQEAMNVLGQL